MGCALKWDESVQVIESNVYAENYLLLACQMCSLCVLKHLPFKGEIMEKNDVWCGTKMML